MEKAFILYCWMEVVRERALRDLLVTLALQQDIHGAVSGTLITIENIVRPLFQ